MKLQSVLLTSEKWITVAHREKTPLIRDTLTSNEIYSLKLCLSFLLNKCFERNTDCDNRFNPNQKELFMFLTSQHFLKILTFLKSFICKII